MSKDEEAAFGEELLVPDEKLSKKFRIQNSRIHLTYPDHIDGETYLKWLGVTFPGKPVTQYSIVKEIGKTGHKHTHVLLKFDGSFQSTNSAVFDFEHKHPNIKPVTTSIHWDRTAKYHKKQNDPLSNIPEDAKKLDHKEKIKAIWDSKSVSDAIMHVCETTKEVGGVIAAFNNKPIDYGEEPKIDWKPWQQDLYNEMQGTPDTRTVAWYWDPKGNAGKTFYAKHMCMYKGTFVSTKANAYHVATQIQDVLKNGNGILSVIFNFSRQVECHKVYQAIECLKDGLMTAEKYHGATLVFPSPHVVVFANYLPDITQMSIDRWSIRVIHPDGCGLALRATGAELEAWYTSYMKQNNRSREDAVEALRKYYENYKSIV